MLITTSEQWSTVSNYLRDTRSFSYDTEYLDYGYPNVSLVGLSLGWRDPSDGNVLGAYVPLLHLDKSLRAIVGQDLESYLTDGSKVVIAHNSKVDIKSTYKGFGFKICAPIFDTMIVSWLLDTVGVGTTKQRLIGQGSHGLKQLVKYHFNYEMTELKEFCPKEKVEGRDPVFRVDQVEPEVMCPYSVDDAIWTFKLAEKVQTTLLGESVLRKVYKTCEQELNLILAEMEIWGTEIHYNNLVAMGEVLSKQIFEVRRNIFESRPTQDFDPVPPDIVENLVHEYNVLEAELKGPAKGAARKQLFAAVDNPALEAKVRDNGIRGDLLAYPELAHKIFNPASVLQLNQILFEECRINPIGDPSEKSGLWSTGSAVLEEWSKTHKITEYLLRFRTLSKIHSTYVVGIHNRLSDQYRVHTEFYRPISTGRLSSRDPNLQNQVKSDEFPIRSLFVGTGIAKCEISEYDGGWRAHGPRGGLTIENGRVASWWGDDPPWPLVVADYSQLEIRILAHMSDDEVLKDILIAGHDIHSATAKLVSDDIPEHITIEEIKELYPDARNNAKPVNFGIIYGMGPNKLAQALDIEKETAANMIEDYLDAYKGVQAWIKAQHDEVRNYGFVKTLLGRKRHLPAGMLRETHDNRSLVWHAQRQAQNAPIQGTAADIIHTAMVDIWRYFTKRAPLGEVEWLLPNEIPGHYKPKDLPFTEVIWGNWFRMLIQVHDEIVGEFHPALANWGLDKLRNLMENAVQLNVPLTVDAKLGINWYAAK